MPERSCHRRSKRRDSSAFVGLIGPDGSGKTTLARELAARSESMGSNFFYVHWRPSLRAMGHAVGDERTAIAKVYPLDRVRTFDRIQSIARLARSAVLFNLAYFLRLRPQLRSGSVIVADRWIYNYVLQPYSVRYYASERLAAFVCRYLVIRPRFIFALGADPLVLSRRTEELGEDDIRLELERTRAQMQGLDVRWLDAEESPSALAGQVFRQLRSG